jgi:cell division protein FtsB
MRMKNLFVFTVFIILLFLPVVLYTKLICDFEDFQESTKLEKFEQNKKIEELEKEIRILKTDIDILNYGYRIEEEDAKKNK